MGAAYLAGLAVNFWGSTDEIARLCGPDTMFEPAAAGKDMGARQAKWRTP
jgi:glycerol kinase